MTDWQLLREYGQKKSEAAFAQLVAKHMSLVYHTCRRSLGDAQLAEDAAQAVFLLLAQKANSIGSSASIAGWLFHSARLTSRNMARAERRRRASEEEAAQRMAHDSQSSPRPQEVEPWLNDALATLTPGELEVVLLRFFDGLSFPEISDQIGTVENTAAKRARYAIEKMRRYLQNKEVAVSSAALAGLLSDQGAQAAPASCHAATMQAIHRLSLGQGAASAPALHPLNSLLAKGILLVSTTKIIAGGVAAVVLILGLTFVVVHKMHSAAFSRMPDATVAWEVPPPSDPVTQQADQQIHAQLDQFSSGFLSGDSQKMISIFSPNFAVDAWDTHNGKPVRLHHWTYSDVAQQMSRGASARGQVSGRLIVMSCSVTSNTAKVQLQGGLNKRWGTRNNMSAIGFNPTSLTFVNIKGRWLITNM